MNVHAGLTFFEEHHCQCAKISLNPMTDLFIPFLLFSAALVQSVHEISERTRHVGSDV